MINLIGLPEDYTAYDLFIQGIHCFKVAEYEKAMGLLLRAAGQDHAEAQYFLGILYEYNFVNGLAYDVENKTFAQSSAYWYEKSADAGYPRALLKTGRISESDAKSLTHTWYEKSTPSSSSYEHSDIFTKAQSYADEDNPERDDCRATQMFHTLASGLKPEQKFDDKDSEQYLAFERLTELYGKGRGIKENDTKISDWLKCMAENGNATAQVTIARMYANGYGLPQDNREAIYWYRKAITDGTGYRYWLPDAEYELGMMYRMGNDHEEAAIWFIKSAQHNYLAAQFLLGHLYREGIGLEQDDSQALRWYREALSDFCMFYHSLDNNAEDIRIIRQTTDSHTFHAFRSWMLDKAVDGNINACFILGIMFLTGIGTKKNLKRASYFIQVTAKNGDMEAQWLMGDFAERGIGGIKKNKKTMFRWRQKAMEQNMVRFDHPYSFCNYDVDKRNFLKKLAKKGNKFAQYELSRHMKQPKRCAELLRQSAEQGNMSAQYELGVHYCCGDGVPQDYSLAAYWLQKAADNPEPTQHFIDEVGLPRSTLGHLYREGKGVERDPEQAVYWYKQSVDDLNEGSCFALAMAYEYGYGVEKNIEVAYKLYESLTGNVRSGIEEIVTFFMEEHLILEVATPCRKKDGYGIVITIYGGEHSPPHANCLDLSGNLLGKFKITKAPPTEIEHIIHLEPEKYGYIPIDSLHQLIKWSTKTRHYINNWKALIMMWGALNEDRSDYEIE